MLALLSSLIWLIIPNLIFLNLICPKFDHKEQHVNGVVLKWLIAIWKVAFAKTSWWGGIILTDLKQRNEYTNHYINIYVSIGKHLSIRVFFRRRGNVYSMNKRNLFYEIQRNSKTNLPKTVWKFKTFGACKCPHKY